MPADLASPEVLSTLAEYIGRDWINAGAYYDGAESHMDRQWNNLVWPFIKMCDFTTCVDLAAGHGRNTRKLLEQTNCKFVYVVDMVQKNIDLCRTRFSKEPRVVCIKNDGFSLQDIPSGTITTFYSFDAMVHFDSDIIRSYLLEIRRVLSPKGHAFLHHSNYDKNPGGDVHDNPGGRNFMTAGLLTHYARKEGLTTVNQKPVDWVPGHALTDCFSLLRRSE
jgi:SAM-dependent methyltransferase